MLFENRREMIAGGEIQLEGHISDTVLRVFQQHLRCVDFKAGDISMGCDTQLLPEFGLKTGQRKPAVFRCLFNGQVIQKMGMDIIHGRLNVRAIFIFGKRQFSCTDVVQHEL